MNKKILDEYIDACELVKETELELERLEGKRSTVAIDKVTGSMNDFPYSQTSFKIEGAVEVSRNDKAIEAQEFVLQERKRKAEKIKLRVERCLNDAPVRMQRIILYRYMKGLSWEQIATKMGRNATGNSVRMELKRFLAEK
ncbi:RNA polymerase subunit sigma-70 [Roseburia hominis]|uniref:sigma-70 region 4 domain-containing protein n=1 Tax=Roseburia hominis TaxID=301301 RepID=UPI001F372FD7|nr:RNA polymerase subunit sigma-70 [Roseburia hominis]